MPNHRNPRPDSDPPPMIYEIRLKGQLGVQWKEWFGGLTITPEDHDYTLLTVPVADQAALHGLLKKVRDLGMPLVSVHQVDSAQGKEKRDESARKGKKRP